MGLFIPNARPRHFHLEIPEREQRRRRLRDLAEKIRCEKDSPGAEDEAQEHARDFSRLRGSFCKAPRRRPSLRMLMMFSVLWMVLLIVVLSALWAWLLN